MLALFVMLATPLVAHAKSYELTSTTIEAQVNSDGSMDVTQTRKVSFSGDFVLLMVPLGSGVDVDIDSVSVDLGNSELGGGELEQVQFQPTWRYQGNPSYQSWAIDSSSNTLYIFANYESVDATVTLKYTYDDVVNVYSDCAELYWKFVPETWEQDSENVTCNVTLPVGSGVTVGAQDVRAWAHGPLSGQITNNADGKVSFSVPSVSAGSYAEARIVFPTSWMSVAPTSTAKLDSILSEEQEWADQANAQRWAQGMVVFVSAALAIALIVISILVWWKYGKEPKPQFTDDYWRDAPEPGIHPAVVSRVMSFNEQDSNELTSSIMWLEQKGFITFDATKTTQQGLLGSKEVDDLVIKKVESAGEPTDPIDKAAYDFLFTTVAQGANELKFNDINSFAQTNGEAFQSAYLACETQIDFAVDNGDYFESKSDTISKIYTTFGLFIMVLAVVAFFFVQSFVPLVFMTVAAAFFLIFSRFMRKRTQHGAEVYAKSNALKKWLKEFSAIDERPPTDVKVWGQFMVYAFALGVAKEAMAQLKIACPQLLEDNVFLGNSSLPWWFWYNNFSIGNTNFAAAGTDFFSQTISNSFAQIQSAGQIISGRGFSSGGGFGGGGFSMGGGGGFGGGGFGGAR